MSRTVAVFFGGNSNEREISVITGMLAVNLLRGADLQVIPVYLPEEGGMVTGEFRGPADFRRGAKGKCIPVRLGKGKLLRARRLPVRIDCALNCCHGGFGEDGTLAALLRFHGIPSASPEVPMSAVFMDKTLTKVAARGLGIPVVEGFSVTERAWEEREEVLKRAEALGYPLIVKPARLGSSIGIGIAEGEEEFSRALGEAFRLDTAALVERYLPQRRDINCAACRIGGRTVLSPLEEVFSHERILTFSEKYGRESADAGKIPADLPAPLAEEISAATELLYETFGGRGVVRADFLVSEGKAYFNELNTVPGSLSVHLFTKSLTEARAFLLSLLDEAEAPVSKERVSSGILEGDLFGKGRGAKHI